jgi:hypothetical protein
MTAAVTPLGILALSGIGAASGLPRRDPLVALCVATVVFVWVTMLVPRAPHHNGVRMFIALFPFLAMLSGYGLHWAWNRMRPRARALVPLAAFVPAAIQLAWIHPVHLAYYGEVVGGVRGAHRLGFETTYWMDACTRPLLDWMNRELPVGANVWVFGTAETLKLEQSYGRLRADLRLDADAAGADWAVVQMWQGIMVPAFRNAIEITTPEHVQEVAGVPLVAVYRLN